MWYNVNIKTRETKMKKTGIDIKRLVYLAIFTALVVLIQFIPIRVAMFEIALSVPVIVVGAALLGTRAGSWLGFVFGFVVLLLPGTAAYLTFNAFGTILTVILKGALAGLAAAVVYNLLAKINRYLAVLISAIVATFVNTGVFLVGSLIFFNADIAYVISVFISVNFLVELLVNIVLVPTVYRVINIKKRV